jgi:mono/diheme cytochrome c family protein
MKRLALLVAGTASCAALAQQPAPSRGELLYENHCGACHTTQMHWRQQRAATDWASLRVLVRRWQGTAQLNWSDDEIDDVARFLNTRFYRYEEPPRRLSRAGG